MPDSLEPGNYLGFDFGIKHIGIAIGQTVSGTASPVCVMPVKNGIDWGKISSIIQEWTPRGLIVGLPLTADGKQTPLLRAVKQFARELAERYSLPVYHIDEHLSSYAAKDLLNESTPRRMARLDDAAAAVILQTWFHQHDDKQ